MAKNDPASVPPIELAGAPQRVNRASAPGSLRHAVLARTAATLAGRVATLGGNLTADQANSVARTARLVADAVCEDEEGG